MSEGERFDRLRLIRSPRIGPVSYRQLLARFGTAGAAFKERTEFFEKEIGTHRTQAKNHELAAEKYAGALEMARFALRQAGF